MPVPSFARKWLFLPGRLALLFGIGALSAAGTGADAAPIGDIKQPVRVPQQSGKTFGEITIWSENGRIFVSEGGAGLQELVLGDTAEARRLQALLEQSGATANAPQTLHHRIILVGGGGDGFHWAPTPPGGNSGPTIAPSASRQDAVQPTVQPRRAHQRPAGAGATPDLSRGAKN